MKNRFLIKAFVLLSVLFSSTFVFAQFTPRDDMFVPEMSCDIKMISSTGWQMAWLKSASPYELARPMTDSEIRTRGGNTLEANNIIAGANSLIGGNQVVPESDTFGAAGYNMIYADCDDDMTTFQSSAALLDFGSEAACAVVDKAYLYWTTTTGNSTANYKVPYPGTSTMKSYNPGGTSVNLGMNGNQWETVKFKIDSDANYSVVSANDPARTATIVDGTTVNLLASRKTTFDGVAVCFADVTHLLKGKGGGLVWVADMYCNIKSQAKFGWSLVVIYKTPNSAPRTIKFWDGNKNELGKGSSAGFDLSLAGLTPASDNTRSYLGFIALDGENFASDLFKRGEDPEYVEVQSLPGGTVYKMNPFALGQTAPFPGEPQPSYPAYDNNGNLVNPEGRDGISSSRISTWDPEKGTNGNDIMRRPQAVNTYGYDAHHLRLPQGAMVANATNVKMTYYAGNQGGTTPYMAYISIETLQADLKLYMRSEGDPQPGGEMTYVLRVENAGPRASKGHGTMVNGVPAQEFIEDILDDEKIDFVPNSVVYRTGIAPQAFEYNGANMDNEILKFYLPSIQEANGMTVQDSVVIEFKVKVKELVQANNHIWAYGCNRTVRNKASLTFSADNGDPLTVGSNATAGCGGAGNYHNSPVVSNELQDQYMLTHNIEETMTDAVDAGNVNIVTTLRNFLIAKYAALNITNPTEIAKYKFYTDGGIEVNPTANFVQGEDAYQNYYAEADLGNGCTETFFYKLLVAKVPKFDEDEIAPGVNDRTTCFGASDAELHIEAYAGTPSYSCSVYDANNVLLYSAFSPDQANYTFVVKGLKAGDYRVEVGDSEGQFKAVKTLMIKDPDPIVPSIKTQCDGLGGITLQASALPATNYDFVWKESTDGTSWSSVLGTGDEYTATGGNKLYQLTACDGECSAISAVILPIISVSPTPQTVSIRATPPAATYNAVLTGTNLATTYNYAWELSSGTIEGTLSGENTASLTVSDIINKAMTGNKYKVTVTDTQLGCVGSAEGELKVIDAPGVELESSTEASCPDVSDGTMTVKISGGEPLDSNGNPQDYLIELRNADNTFTHTLNYVAPAELEETVTDLPAGIYTWYVHDVTGTISYGPYTITALPRPETELTVEEAVCFGQEVIATASGDHPSYQWTINGVLDAETGSSYTYDYETNTLAPGSYLTLAVIALSDLNCPSVAQTAMVQLKEIPESFPENAFASCIEPYGKYAWENLIDNTVNNYDIRWYDAKEGGEPMYFPHAVDMSHAGEYSKYVVAIGEGCPSLRSEMKVTIHPSPKIDRAQVGVGSVQISLSDGLAPYTYDFEGTRVEMEPEKKAFELIGLLPLGKHNFLIIDANGCPTEGMFVVDKALLEPAPYFSPNGKENTPLWTIKNLELYLDANISIEIFDRLGKRLYYANAKDFRGWDGTFNGQEMPSTDYWYSIYIQQTDERVVGNFTLKR